MAFNIISGSGSSDIATVDPTSKSIRMQIYDSGNNSSIVPHKTTPISNSQGGIPLLLRSTDGNLINSIRIDNTGIARTGSETTLFWDSLEPGGAGVPLNVIWWANSTTATISTGGDGYVLNNNNSIGATNYASIGGTKGFSKILKLPILFQTRAAITDIGQGFIVELGLARVTNQITSTTESNFIAMFRYDRDSTFKLIIGSNNTANASLPELTYLVPKNKTPISGNYYRFSILLDDQTVRFIIEDPSNLSVLLDYTFLLGIYGLPLPGSIFQKLYPIFRTTNPSSTFSATAPGKIALSSVQVSQLDAAYNMSWPYQLAAQERNNLIGPISGTQNANYTNSAAPTTRTISNTTALETTLGGLFAFNNAGTSFAGGTTDYQMFTYTIPTGFQFYITGIRISCLNMGAANGANQYNLQWSLGVNSNADSLATGSPYPPIRIPLGTNGLAPTAAIGALFTPDIALSFGTPIVVESGRRLHVIVKVHTGAATASQIIRGTCMIEGYYE